MVVGVGKLLVYTLYTTWIGGLDLGHLVIRYSHLGAVIGIAFYSVCCDRSTTREGVINIARANMLADFT